MSLLPPRLVAGLAWALVERKKRSVARKQSSPAKADSTGESPVATWLVTKGRAPRCAKQVEILWAQ